MTEISMSMIKELRDRTGVGIGSCKEALSVSNGNMDEAITFLRKKGIASAVKKEGRATNEGIICASEANDCVTLVEVNAETDFVAKNDKFQDFVKTVAEEVAHTKPASLESFLQQKLSRDGNMTIEEFRINIVQTIGENIQIRRLAVLPRTSSNSLGIYSHMGGKIVVAVELNGAGEEDLAKEIAMHTAAAAPDFLSPETVPADILNHEKDIIKSQIKGKPENMIDKIVDGKLNAFYKDRCLTEQSFVKDDKVSIKELVAARAKETGKPLLLKNFMRWTVGE